jgi:hypothetical protein
MGYRPWIRGKMEAGEYRTEAAGMSPGAAFDLFVDDGGIIRETDMGKGGVHNGQGLYL